MDDGSDHGSLCLTSCCVVPKPLVHNEAAVDAALEGGSDMPSNEAQGIHQITRLRADAHNSFSKLGRCGGASSGKDVRCPTLTRQTHPVLCAGPHIDPNQSPASTHRLPSCMFRHNWQVPLPTASGIVPNEVLPLRAVLRVRKISRELEDISAIELCEEALNSRSGSRSGSRSRSSSTSGSSSNSSPCGLHVMRRGSPVSVQMEHLVLARATTRPPASVSRLQICGELLTPSARGRRSGSLFRSDSMEL